MEFTVHLEQDEDGAFIATVASLPGCHTFGFSREEARERVKEASSSTWRTRSRRV